GTPARSRPRPVGDGAADPGSIHERAIRPSGAARSPEAGVATLGADGAADSAPRACRPVPAGATAAGPGPGVAADPADCRATADAALDPGLRGSLPGVRAGTVLALACRLVR